MEKKIKQLVRICDSDIDGNKRLYHALTKIKGVDFSLSNALCIVANFDKELRIGELSDEDLEKIKDIINNPLKYNLPAWMLNRRKDYDTGEDIHLYSSNLKLRKSFDIKRLQKIKSYRGLRHSKKLTVRGQRTRAHFRSGKSLGVKKKAGAKKGK